MNYEKEFSWDGIFIRLVMVEAEMAISKIFIRRHSSTNYQIINLHNCSFFNVIENAVAHDGSLGNGKQMLREHSVGLPCHYLLKMQYALVTTRTRVYPDALPQLSPPCAGIVTSHAHHPHLLSGYGCGGFMKRWRRYQGTFPACEWKPTFIFKLCVFR